MPNIIYSPTAQLVQVEDFPADCERTVKGALYVRPGTSAVVSDDEAKHLKARGIVFSVVGASKPPKPPPKPAAPPAQASNLSGPPLITLPAVGPQKGSQADQK